MSGQPATNYHIASSHVNVAQLRGNVRIAEKLGLRDEVLKAYRHIVQKLTTDPKG